MPRTALLLAVLCLFVATLPSCEKKRRVLVQQAPSELKGGKLIFEEAFGAGLENWATASKQWRVEEGRLSSGDGPCENEGLWLKGVDLPPSVRIEFEAQSVKGNNPVFEGDLKFEFGGTEPKHLSGYILIFGGWKNSLNTIAKQEEHTARLVVDRETKVQEGKTYKVAVVRKGGRISWFLDGSPFLTVQDKTPLNGPIFGFNNWNSRFFVDNLKIYKL
jgi:hypothetical protein